MPLLIDQVKRGEGNYHHRHSLAMGKVGYMHTGAAWGGLSTASYISAGGDFPGKIVVQYLAYFLGTSLLI